MSCRHGAHSGIMAPFACETSMLSPDQFLAFLAAAVLITASPGPDNLMVLGVGMSRGRRQGMAFGLGCALGCLTHTVLAINAAVAAAAQSLPAGVRGTR